MAKAAPAKHKIRVASHSLSRRVASAQPATSFVQNTNRIVQWRRKNDQNAMPANGPTDKWYGKGAAAILFAAALPLPAAICAPPSSPPFLPLLTFLSFLQQERVPKESQKLQIDGDWRTFKTLSLLS